MQECNNQPSVPSLDLLGVFQESTLFFDFLRVLNAHILTYSVYNSVLADIKKCKLNHSDTHSEFHDAEGLIFAEFLTFCSVAHLWEIEIILCNSWQTYLF